jgi:hypothetical protein
MGLDIAGRLQVNHQQSGSLSGVRFSGGWALSPHVSAGVQSVFYPMYTERKRSWQAGPEVRWYPLEEAGLALRAGLNALHFREDSEVLSPDGLTTLPRIQRYRGVLAHVGAAASQPIGERALFEIGVELGFPLSGVWHDSRSGPVSGRPKSVVLWFAFGIN